MKEKNSVRILLLCFLLVVALFLSILFLSHRFNHSCVDDGCQVCLLIERFADWQGIAFSALAAAFLSFSLAGTLAKRPSFADFSDIAASPVILKDKLSN